MQRMTAVGNGLAPFRLLVFEEGVALSTSLPGQGPFPTKDASWQMKSRQRWVSVVGNGLAPFRLVEFAEGVKHLPYER